MIKSLLRTLKSLEWSSFRVYDYNWVLKYWHGWLKFRTRYAVKTIGRKVFTKVLRQEYVRKYYFKTFEAWKFAVIHKLYSSLDILYTAIVKHWEMLMRIFYYFHVLKLNFVYWLWDIVRLSFPIFKSNA